MTTPMTLPSRVAVEVMGHVGALKIFYGEWDEYKTCPMYIPSGKPRRTHAIDAIPLPPYSTNIGAAWLVVEKMRERGFEMYLESDHGMPGRFYCSFHDSDGCKSGMGDSAPEAICLAALSALTAKE